ncbi:MAG TPA: YdhR family protein [Acidimicrobiales bacterium]|nr:YdhR family protein [Acidimicrobiales bacterium]
MNVVIVNFALDGMSDAEYIEMCDHLAPGVAAIDGLLSKVWLSDPDTNTFGGVYLFDSPTAVELFFGSQLFADVASHPNLVGAHATRFGVLEAPTRVTRGFVTSDV